MDENFVSSASDIFSQASVNENVLEYTPVLLPRYLSTLSYYPRLVPGKSNWQLQSLSSRKLQLWEFVCRNITKRPPPGLHLSLLRQAKRQNAAYSPTVKARRIDSALTCSTSAALTWSASLRYCTDTRAAVLLMAGCICNKSSGVNLLSGSGHKSERAACGLPRCFACYS